MASGGGTLVAEAKEPDQPIALDPNQSNPLQFSWSVWYTHPKSGKGAWESKGQMRLSNFDTVEKFWQIFNNLSPPSGLKPGGDLQIFRMEARPEWEDPFNVRGGSWTVW